MLLYTGNVRGHCQNAPIGLSDGLIRVVQEKTGAELSTPLHPALIVGIKAAPANGVTLTGDANGRPIKRATLTLLTRKAVKLVGLPTHSPAAWTTQGDLAPPGGKSIIG